MRLEHLLSGTKEDVPKATRPRQRRRSNAFREHLLSGIKVSVKIECLQLKIRNGTNKVTNSCLLANKFISLYIVREKVEQATLAVQVCASLLSSLKRESTIFDILYNNSTSKFRISKVNTLE